MLQQKQTFLQTANPYRNNKPEVFWFKYPKENTMQVRLPRFLLYTGCNRLLWRNLKASEAYY